MDTWWERVLPGQYPIVAYRCIASQLPEFQRKTIKRGNPKGVAQMTLEIVADTEDSMEHNSIETGKHTSYLLRLPYTMIALERLYERCPEDCPDWYIWERIPYAFDRT